MPVQNKLPLLAASIVIPCLSAHVMLAMCQVSRVTSPIPFKTVQTQLLCHHSNYCFIQYVFFSLQLIWRHNSSHFSSVHMYFFGYLNVRIRIANSLCRHTFALKSFRAMEKLCGRTGKGGFPQPASLYVVIPNNRQITSQAQQLKRGGVVTHSACMRTATCFPGMMFFLTHCQVYLKWDELPQTTVLQFCNSNHHLLTQQLLDYDLLYSLLYFFPFYSFFKT